MQFLSSEHKFQFYGRRQSRKLSTPQKQVWEQWYDALTLSEKAFQDISVLMYAFSKPLFHKNKVNNTDFALEIGSGGGEFLICQAKKNPQINYIGVEPFINGYSKILGTIIQERIENVRLYPGDIRPLTYKIPHSAFQSIFIHYPDPWPKKKHFRRRLIQKEFIEECARILKSDGNLNITSDDASYQDWIWILLQDTTSFERLEGEKNSYIVPPENWVRTRYEEKALRAHRQPLYFCWRRVKHTD